VLPLSLKTPVQMSTISQSACISRHNVGWALGMVLLAAALSLSAPHRLPTEAAGFIALITADEAEAVSFVGSGSTAASPSPTSAVEHRQQTIPLFGMDTEPVASGDVVEKWTHAKAAIDQELDAVAQCRANADCSPVAQRVIDLSASGEGQSGRARIGLINRAVDLAISRASDQAQWGVADHWSAPSETLRSSRGDCEDYATLKYLALRAAGISQNDVKIVVLKNVFPDEDHAAVAVRVGDEWLILDNRTLTLVRDTDLTRAIPRFVLDQQGARRFVWASRRPRSAAVSGT
jgi:predicted transglutaminase-like cysteine proteinase